jgi:hypothetical protein
MKGSVMHQNTDTAVHELTAMSEALQDYLLDDRLFKTITVSSPAGDRLIKMTIGGMLERLEELESQGAASQAVAQAREALERAKRSQPDRFYERLGREAKSYADSWNWFLQNCWEGAARCRSDYAQEVPIRLRLEQILAESGEHQELAESRRRVRTLDERLRSIWEEEDEPLLGNRDRFPRDPYWWLYGRPQPQPDNG